MLIEDGAWRVGYVWSVEQLSQIASERGAKMQNRAERGALETSERAPTMEKHRHQR